MAKNASVFGSVLLVSGGVLAFVLSLLAFPGFSVGPVSCSAPCAVGDLCECSIASCPEGVMIVSELGGMPIGSFPVRDSIASWMPPKETSFTLQANCDGILSDKVEILPAKRSENLGNFNSAIFLISAVSFVALLAAYLIDIKLVKRKGKN